MKQKFQFPSNGKVLSDIKYTEKGFLTLVNVSIPFKRESPFGHVSTGEVLAQARFQFPSNGKVLSDAGVCKVNLHNNADVFQFPSNGKVLSDAEMDAKINALRVGFNSLQTGKSFRTHLRQNAYYYNKKFQFPSNGKVLSDILISKIHLIENSCFNSLQTGKSFRTPGICW